MENQPARPNVSVVIIAKNEEEMLPGCLARLAWADEIVVVDDFSADRTADIARAAGARVLTRAFTDFATQLNYGMDNAAGEWLLLIDADELATAGLEKAVRDVTTAANPRYKVYEVLRDSFVFGQRMRSRAWSGEWRARLIRKGAARYVGEVHSGLEPVLPTGKLQRAKLLHYTYRSTEMYFEKFQSYSTLWARKARAAGRHSGLAKACAAGAWRVFHNYFIRGECLDGRQGLMLSLLAGMHTFVRHVKLWGLENKERLARTAPPSPPPPPKEKKEPSA